MIEKKFDLVSSYQPRGDQVNAIEELCQGIRENQRAQTLLGVTGSGKTFTIANVIEKMNKPTLIMSHNKTLAAQLYGEFKQFFPNNAVEYFVSYYDYYQPEAYVPTTDTYIEKDADINAQIDKLRLRATSSLLERRDVIIVASVSCIYGLGSPNDYRKLHLYLEVGMEIEIKKIMRQLVEMQYTRNEMDFARGMFRLRGDTLEIFPAYAEIPLRVEFFGDEIESISEIDPVTGEIKFEHPRYGVYPAKHFVTSPHQIESALSNIEEEMNERVRTFIAENKLIEAQRIEQRTHFDMEMLKEIGYCSGIENYSRHLDGRPAGSRPSCLLDYFPDDWLFVIDESHVTVPQIRGMYAGDYARKKTLIDYGFRLPSSLDNRPLKFDELNSLLNQTIYVSATPNDYEIDQSEGVIVEQIVRPTGLIDPEIIVRPVKYQIDDLIKEINATVAREERVLVTTLTKRMAEDLSDYLHRNGINVRYLHSDIDTMERMQLLRDLRLGEYDVLVGINLLREGLDLPEVSLVAILDADKTGFLRSETSLIQTIGRAARNVNGRVIMYADGVSDAMRKAIQETERRRAKQMVYNEAHGITPQTIKKTITSIMESTSIADGVSSKETKRESPAARKRKGRELLAEQLQDLSRDDMIAALIAEMNEAAENMDFEKAANIRDRIIEIKLEQESLQK